MPHANRPCLRRLLALDRMLREKTYPNSRTAALELEVHRRTVHRDLEFLRDSWGAPLAFDRGRNGFYYRDSDWPLPSQRLSEKEVVAFFLAERLLQEYEGGPYAGVLARLFEKMTAALPEDVTVDLSHLAGAYSFRHRTTNPVDPQHFEALARAVRHRRRVEIDYWTASRDETQNRLVEPYHLTAYDGCWYLIAFCHRRTQVLMFALGRIRALRETDERFEKPADFSIQSYFGSSFGAMRANGPAVRVRVRFTAEAAKYVRERSWHASQQLTEEEGGTLLVTFEVTHLLEVRRWAMAWGPDCEVLEPPELRAQVVVDLRKALLQYQGRKR